MPLNIEFEQTLLSSCNGWLLFGNNVAAIWASGFAKLGIKSTSTVRVISASGCIDSTTAHNSTYVHRRPFGAPRAPRRCGAPLHHMAPRPGWARGHVTYVRNSIGHCDMLQSLCDIISSRKEGAWRAVHADATRRRAILIGLAVAFAWSTSWVLIKVGLKDIPVLTFAALRYSIASICLVPALSLRPVCSSNRLPSRRMWFRLVGLGVLLYAVTQGAMFLALDNMPAVSVNLLWSFSAVVVALLGIKWLGERPTCLQWVGMAICTAGAVLYYYPAGFQAGQQVGLLACGIGVLANAAAAILGRSINRSRELQPVVVTLISMSVGAALLLPIGIAIQGLPAISPNNWLIIGSASDRQHSRGLRALESDSASAVGH